MNKPVPRDERVVRLDNPLKLAFDTPKSERNLRSSTVFNEPGVRKDDHDRDKSGREGPIPTEFGYTFSISQILG